MVEKKSICWIVLGIGSILTIIAVYIRIYIIDAIHMVITTGSIWDYIFRKPDVSRFWDNLLNIFIISHILLVIVIAITITFGILALRNI